MKPALLAAALAVCALGMAPAFAIDSEPAFADPVLQDRYETLTHEFRCLVCQDETVADSNADLAADFRRQIHAMVEAGKTDSEIKSYMVNRYGNFVLYKPPLQSSTALLWIGPFILLLVGLSVIYLVVRRR
ncbi:MAG TPA: cytochrome c-type biogenesis protein, partial [Gammaproteobacteria bacterium]